MKIATLLLIATAILCGTSCRVKKRMVEKSERITIKRDTVTKIITKVDTFRVVIPSDTQRSEWIDTDSPRTVVVWDNWRSNRIIVDVNKDRQVSATVIRDSIEVVRYDTCRETETIIRHDTLREKEKTTETWRTQWGFFHWLGVVLMLCGVALVVVFAAKIFRPHKYF